MRYKGRNILKHSRGNWYARIRFDGKRFAVYGRTQAEAYEKLRILVEKIEVEKQARFLTKAEYMAGTAVLPGISIQQSVQAESRTTKAYTLREWFDEWLNSYKVGHVRAVTVDSFKSDFKYLRKLHDTELGEISNIMLSKAISEVVSNRRKDKVHNLLKQMFSAAFNNRFIESNPALTLPRPKQFAKNEKKAFTAEQEKRFIDICLADLGNYEPFLICLLQGLRKGEMFALRPNDFDFENNILRIDESYDQAYPDDLQTKNDASNRKMPMFELTKKILLKYADNNPKERIYAMSDTTLDKRLNKLFKQNPDLPRLTAHELRHTFISRCHEKRIDEIIVQKWVGHAIGSRMTKAVYTHVSDDAERRYIELLNRK